MKIFALSAEWMNLIQSLNMLVLKANHKWGGGVKQVKRLHL